MGPVLDPSEPSPHSPANLHGSLVALPHTTPLDRHPATHSTSLFSVSFFSLSLFTSPPHITSLLSILLSASLSSPLPCHQLLCFLLCYLLVQSTVSIPFLSVFLSYHSLPSHHFTSFFIVLLLHSAYHLSSLTYHLHFISFFFFCSVLPLFFVSYLHFSFLFCVASILCLIIFTSPFCSVLPLFLVSSSSLHLFLFCVVIRLLHLAHSRLSLFLVASLHHHIASLPPTLLSASQPPFVVLPHLATLRNVLHIAPLSYLLKTSLLFHPLYCPSLYENSK